MWLHRYQLILVYNIVAFGELSGSADESNSCADTLHTRLVEGQCAYLQSPRRIYAALPV